MKKRKTNLWSNRAWKWNRQSCFYVLGGIVWFASMPHLIRQLFFLLHKMLYLNKTEIYKKAQEIKFLDLIYLFSLYQTWWHWIQYFSLGRETDFLYFSSSMIVVTCLPEKHGFVMKTIHCWIFPFQRNIFGFSVFITILKLRTSLFRANGLWIYLNI